MVDFINNTLTHQITRLDKYQVNDCLFWYTTIQFGNYYCHYFENVLQHKLKQKEGIMLPQIVFIGTVTMVVLALTISYFRFKHQ